jgi:aspartyl-tRNA(Asn)/glutamyl-tRNA(Gln) amidotransferase subunit A
LLQAGLLSVADLTAACAQNRLKHNGPVTFDGAADQINAWIRLYPDLAGQLTDRAQATLDGARRGGAPAPLLCGVPLALKDLYAVAGKPLTASSRVLEGNVAPGDSVVWERLRAAGMVLLGHTHTHEFALGFSTPQTGNPWNVTKIPGGSSGGSAAAVAARMVTAATGTDTGGSLRVPSSACGISTIKSTYGLVPTAGVIPLQWSYDNAGPMARTIGDCALMLSAMAGPDARDPSSLAPARPTGRYPTLPRGGSMPLSGTRIGVPSAPRMALAGGVAKVQDGFLASLKSLGATLVTIAVPASPLDASLPATIATLAEADVYHRAYFPARAAEYRPQIAEVLAALRAANISAFDFIDAQKRRAALIGLWSEVFHANRLDAYVEPTQAAETPDRSTAGEQTVLTRPSPTPLTTLWDDTGFPALSLPGGRSPVSGMPVGMQVVGTPGGEAPLLQIGIDIQANTPYHLERPGILPS